MGFGDTPFGQEPFCGDVAVTTYVSPADHPPIALAFDPMTRDIPMDTNGRYGELHPVDHRMALAIFVSLGKLRASPDMGGTVDQVAIDDDVKMQADAERRVRAAAKDLISNGDIRLVSVQSYAQPRWRANVKVVYMNLRQPNTKPRTIDTGLIPVG